MAFEQRMTEFDVGVKNTKKREKYASIWSKGIFPKPSILPFKLNKNIDFSRPMKHQIPSFHAFFSQPQFLSYATTFYAYYL